MSKVLKIPITNTILKVLKIPIVLNTHTLVQIKEKTLDCGGGGHLMNW